MYAYGWTPDNTSLLGAWGGTVMTEDYNGWRYITVPADPSDDLNVIFHDSQGDNRTEVVVNDRNAVYFTGDGNGYKSKIEAETALGVPLSVTKVYFYNTAGWDRVGAYGDLGEAFGGWPGVEATDEGDGWYSATLPGLASDGLYVIFNLNP